MRVFFDFTVGLVSELDFMVSGVAPHGNDLAVLTYNEEDVQHEVHG